MQLSEEKIAEVRDRADILAVIGKRVQLRKMGRTYVGLCPFHNEKGPSFNVIPDRGFYHCFGCQASGDVFKFIMETEHTPFPIVVRDLAKEVGVEIPETEEAPAEKKARERREWLYRVNDYVNEFFVHTLWNARDAGHARAYVEKRQLSKETALTFAVGYAPRRAEELVRYLEHKNVPVEAAIELGVLGRRDDKSLYLRFFDRLMFPIHDERDRIAGFGGRVLEADAKSAKYLNSPESMIFKKSRLLYGYSKAKNAIARKSGAWLCEGYLDVIALHQAGCDQAVAPLGTAVTEDHLPLLRRVTTKIRTVFDGDSAGLRATRKSSELLLAHGFSVNVVQLPDGDDPDTYVLREGAEKMLALADKAPPTVQFFIERAAAQMEPSVEGRVAAASDVAPLIAKVTSQLERDLYVKEAAKRLGIDDDSLRKFFGRAPAPQGSVAAVRSEQPVRTEARATVAARPPPPPPRAPDADVGFDPSQFDEPIFDASPLQEASFSGPDEQPRLSEKPGGFSGKRDGKWGKGKFDGKRKDEQRTGVFDEDGPWPPRDELAGRPGAPPALEWAGVRRLLAYRSTWGGLPQAMAFLSHPGLRKIVEICIDNPDNLDFETLSALLDGRTELVSNLAKVLADDRSPLLQEGERDRLMEDVLSKLEHYSKRRALPDTAATLEDETELMRRRVALAREQKMKPRK